LLTKDRNILRHEWEDLRADIDHIIKAQNLSQTEFRSLDIHSDWETIEESIYHVFCKLDHPTQRPIWLWEYFKLDTFGVTNEQPFKYLSKLVDNDESVWFFVNGDKDKFWFYEGKINSIVTVIEESSYIDELYIASKKYNWLICINHHDDLIATGQTMPDRLRQLKATTQNIR